MKTITAINPPLWILLSDSSLGACLSLLLSRYFLFLRDCVFLKEKPCVFLSHLSGRQVQYLALYPHASCLWAFEVHVRARLQCAQYIRRWSYLCTGDSFVWVNTPSRSQWRFFFRTTAWMASGYLCVLWLIDVVVKALNWVCVSSVVQEMTNATVRYKMQSGRYGWTALVGSLKPV